MKHHPALQLGNERSNQPPAVVDRQQIEKIVSLARPAFTPSALAEAWTIADKDSMLEEQAEAMNGRTVTASYREKVTAHLRKIISGELSPAATYEAKLDALAIELRIAREAIDDERASLNGCVIDPAKILAKEAAAGVLEFAKLREIEEAARATEIGVEFEPSLTLRTIAAAYLRLDEVSRYAHPMSGIGAPISAQLWFAPRECLKEAPAKPRKAA